MREHNLMLNLHAKHYVRRWEEGWEGSNANKVHSTALCYHARLMLRTTPILYCKRAALHHVRTAHPIHSLVTIGPPSSSTLSEKGLGDEATRALASGQISARRRDSARLYSYLVPTRASSLVNQTVLGCAWA